MNGVSYFYITFCRFLVKLHIEISDLHEVTSYRSKNLSLAFKEDEAVLLFSRLLIVANLFTK